MVLQNTDPETFNYIQSSANQKQNSQKPFHTMDSSCEVHHHHHRLITIIANGIKTDNWLQYPNVKTEHMLCYFGCVIERITKEISMKTIQKLNCLAILLIPSFRKSVLSDIMLKHY